MLLLQNPILTAAENEGLVEAWSCSVKVKSRKKNCQNGVITGAELRRISCEIMGTEAFDEYEFTHTIKQITIYSDGKMIYEFYNGRNRHKPISSKMKTENTRIRTLQYTVTSGLKKDM